MLSSRLDWIDGAKGIFAIIVVVCHIFVTIRVGGDHPIIIHNLYDGNFAVSAFIVLSSMLTCHGIELNRERLLYKYQNIVLKRYFRLVIPVGVIIIAMYFANLLGLFYSEEYGQKTNNEWLINITADWRDLPGMILGAPFVGAYTILRVSWMLQYVFLGTMWIIILDIMLHGKAIATKLFLLSICGYIAWKMNFYYVNVIAGYGLYFFCEQIYCKRFLRFGLILSLFIIFVVSDVYVRSFEWNMVRAICVVAICMLTQNIKAILSTSFFVWLGKISMNIYLLQLFVIYSFTCRMADVLEHNPMNIFIIVILSLSFIIIAFIYTIYVETRLNKITNKIVERLV